MSAGSHLRLGRWALAITIATGLSCMPLFATPNKPGTTQVDSDRLVHDDRRLTTIFDGRVALRRGGLLLRGDRLELRQGPDGSNFGTLLGGPAKFQYIRGAFPEGVTMGEAARIDYDSGLERVVLSGNAVLIQLVSGRESHRILGERVVYDLRSEHYRSESESGANRSKMMTLPNEGQPN